MSARPQGRAGARVGTWSRSAREGGLGSPGEVPPRLREPSVAAFREGPQLLTLAFACSAVL